MKFILAGFNIVTAVMAGLFVCAAIALMVIAARLGWHAVSSGMDAEAAQLLIEAIGLLAASVVALQIGQTVWEEEVLRTAQVTAPTRVRRFLSRFLVVLVVALVVEGLVATFKAMRENLELLPYAAQLLAASALLLAGWGVFIWCNRRAEDVEPQALREVQQEDRALKE